MPQERPNLFDLLYPIKDSPWPPGYNPEPIVRAILDAPPDISRYIERFKFSSKDEPDNLRPGVLTQV